MLNRFVKHIEEDALFTKKDDLLLAFSGGADSVALFHLLREANYPFRAAHVNYRLRGRDSDEDERFVRELCKEYKIDLEVKKVDSEHWGKGENVQKEARDIRYRFFGELNPTRVLSAHHKDDNVETILMNITRGTGLRGLTGMKTLSNSICRPLLIFEKEELISYLKSNDFSWREDASNLSDKYKRNRFRNEIIPLLKEENPSLNSAIERLIENVSSIADQLEKSFQGFLDSLVKKDADQIRISKGRPDQLDLHLYEFLHDYGFNRDQVKNIIASLAGVGRAFQSDSHTLYIDRKDLILIAEHNSIDHEFVIYEHTSAMLSPLKLRFTKSEDLQINSDPKCAQFDYSKLVFPLILRNWRAGDYIHPLGMHGSKKISDILIDKKVSRADKKDVYVLLSGDEIIWIPGIMINDKMKVNKSTKVVYKVELM